MQKLVNKRGDEKAVGYRISIRLTEEEKQQFERVRAMIGRDKVTDTEVFRYLLAASKGMELKSPVSKEQLDLWRQFIAVGNNINQIAKALNTLNKDKKVDAKALGKQMEKVKKMVEHFSVIAHDSQDK